MSTGWGAAGASAPQDVLFASCRRMPRAAWQNAWTATRGMGGSHGMHITTSHLQACNQTLWDALTANTNTYHNLLSLKSPQYNAVAYLNNTLNVATVFAPTDTAMLSSLRTLAGAKHTNTAQHRWSTPVYRFVRGHRRTSPGFVCQCKRVQFGCPVQCAARCRVQQGLAHTHGRGCYRALCCDRAKLHIELWQKRYQGMLMAPVVVVENTTRYPTRRGLPLHGGSGGT